MNRPVIWWVRRDLRLHDNPTLQAALATGRPVIPLFILDDLLLSAYAQSEKRLAFFFASLRQLDGDLEVIGSRLVVRRGRVADVLPRVLRAVEGMAVFAQMESDPYGRARDEAVANLIPLNLIDGLTIRPLGCVLKKNGEPYTVFTPYKKRWFQLKLPSVSDLHRAPAYLALGEIPLSVGLEPIPESPMHRVEALFPAGETAARDRLRYFLGNEIYRYHQRRDVVADVGTSALSPYLTFGLISGREAAVGALEAIALAGQDGVAREGGETWLSELIWRDFYHDIQRHFPHVRERNFRSDYDSLEWRNDEAEFAAWCEGRTGYPIVDAAMRQMNETGWMHNRARMIVASFLVKDLLIDWRWGERYFMEKLIDGEGAANNGGWQWSAGTGTDAAPYFRIFNPLTQSKKFDPEGDYIRRWVPELAALDKKQIHAPWEMLPLRQQSIGVVVGRDYPRPLVDHRAARARTLAAYKAAKVSQQ